MHVPSVMRERERAAGVKEMRRAGRMEDGLLPVGSYFLSGR